MLGRRCRVPQIFGDELTACNEVPFDGFSLNSGCIWLHAWRFLATRLRSPVFNSTLDLREEMVARARIEPATFRFQADLIAAQTRSRWSGMDQLD
jgi:hypothetical protein